MLRIRRSAEARRASASGSPAIIGPEGGGAVRVAMWRFSPTGPDRNGEPT